MVSQQPWLVPGNAPSQRTTNTLTTNAKAPWDDLVTALLTSENAFQAPVKVFEGLYIPAGFFVLDTIDAHATLRLSGTIGTDEERGAWH